MSKHAVMPITDYVNACDALREKTGTTEPIKSGDIPKKVNDVYDMGKLATLKDSRYMNGKESGAIVSVNDVTPIEHNVGVKVASKSLIDFPQKSATRNKWDNSANWGLNYIDVSHLRGKTITYQATYDLTNIDVNNASNYTDLYGCVVIRFYNPDLSVIGVYAGNDIIGQGKVGISKITKQVPDVEGVLAGFDFRSSFYGYGDTLALGEDYIKVSNPMVELGVTASKYTPYVEDFSNITLTRAKNLGKYVFTGEEAFYLAGSGFPYGFYTYDYITDYNRTSNIQVWCTHFECVHNSEIDNENATFTFCQYNGIWYFNYDNQKGGVANFKEWLRQNYRNGTPVTVCYKKVDTTDEDFTDYTANADGTVEGVKSISPNMTLIPNNNAVTVECEYLRDIDLYIDNLLKSVAMIGGE